MKVFPTFAVGAVALCACSTVPHGAPTPICSRYEVGDYVIYRTVQLRDGQEETIHLLERVDEKRCRKLVLHDWLVGAGEPREWKMFLTDTPENQANNIADKVMEKTSTGWVSVKTADLRRLFNTGVDVDGQTKLVSKSEGRCRVVGRDYACTTKTTQGTVKGVPIVVTCRTSRKFLWANIGCEFKRVADGGHVFRMEVVETGRIRPGELPDAWRRVINP